MMDRLRQGLMVLTDEELHEQAFVWAGVRDHLAAEGRGRQADLHAVMVALCLREQARRKRELRDLEAQHAGVEDVTAWWGPPYAGPGSPDEGEDAADEAAPRVPGDEPGFR